MSCQFKSEALPDSPTESPIVAEVSVAIFRQVVRDSLPPPDETGKVVPSLVDMKVIENAADAFKTFAEEMKLKAANTPELFTPEDRVIALQCLAEAMKVVPTGNVMQWARYFTTLQLVAETTVAWEAGPSISCDQVLATRGFTMTFAGCKLPGIERVAADLLEGIASSWRALRAHTDAVRQQMAEEGRVVMRGEASYLFLVQQTFSRAMAIFLVWFHGVQGLGDDAAIVQEGKAILLQAYQEAVGPMLLSQMDATEWLSEALFRKEYKEGSMDSSMIMPVALHSLFSGDAPLMHAMFDSSTAALEGIPAESMAPADIEALPERLKLLHMGCSLALSTRPQPPLASVVACLAAWRTLTTVRVCNNLSMSETAERSIKRLVVRLEAAKKAQEREAKAAKREAGMQATAASSQAEADAAMQALLAEEEQAAQRQAAKKGRKKARQHAKKAEAAGQRQTEMAPLQPANGRASPPRGSCLLAPSTPVAQRLGGSPRQQDAAADADVCTGSVSPSASGGEQARGPSHPRDLEQTPAGSQPQPPRELLDSPAAAEQDSLATQAGSLAVDPPRSPAAAAGSQAPAEAPTTPAAHPRRPRPPQRGGGPQSHADAGQPTAVSRAGGSGQQLLNRLQLEELCTCPITQELFVEPVIASDGFTYERAAIEAWIARKGVSPMTEAPLVLSSLQPSIAASQMVAVFHSLGR